MKTKLVFVIGPPASGKSTFTELVCASLIRRGISCGVVNDLQCLLEICPPEVISEKYSYQNGSLVLVQEFVEEAIRAQFLIVVSEIKNFEGKVDFCFVEFTSLNWEQTFCDYFSDYLSKNADLVYVNVGKEESLQRNRKRTGVKKVPEEYVNKFTNKDIETIESLKEKFRKVRIVQNEAGLVNLEENVELFADNIEEYLTEV